MKRQIMKRQIMKRQIMKRQISSGYPNLFSGFGK
jgi:hypothetical protein